MYKHLARVFAAILAAIQGLLFFISVAQAQSTILDLPRASQHAVVTQRIGITDVSINYHRPLVNKRKIWGGVVPYGDVWRAGANENTTIAFSDPVSVEGKTLPKGTYGLHMIPGENEWTVIFSRNSTSWGSFTYDQKEDALRVAVKPQPAEFHEALTYDFDDTSTKMAIGHRSRLIGPPPLTARTQMQRVVTEKTKAQTSAGDSRSVVDEISPLPPSTASHTGLKKNLSNLDN